MGGGRGHLQRPLQQGKSGGGRSQLSSASFPNTAEELQVGETHRKRNPLFLEQGRAENEDVM